MYHLNMPKISAITSYKIVNSRGNWTLRTKVWLDDGSYGVETIPEGASKGQNEAIYIDVNKAVEVINIKISRLLRGRDPFNQKEIDKLLIDLDGTSNKSNLGGNSILSVSLAVSKACANSLGIELYEYLSQIYNRHLQPHPEFTLPTPLFNVINGGKHAHNDLSFQEFMIIPATSFLFDKAYELGVTVYNNLKTILEEAGCDVGVGDEGGFAPSDLTPEKALDFLKKAASKNYMVGKEIFFGLDVAAESFYNHGRYTIFEKGFNYDGTELANYYQTLMKKYELIYLEDPFYEKDIQSWKEFSKTIGNSLLLCADDLVVTNPTILKQAIKDKLCNAVIVKPNQIGTLTETIDFIREAQENNLTICVSHRSGDTAEDTFIADLAVAVGADFIKSGAPARGERVAKYNRLLEIFHDISSR